MTELIPFIKAYLVYISIVGIIILGVFIYFGVLILREVFKINKEVDKSFKESKQRHEARVKEFEASKEKRSKYGYGDGEW